MGVHLLYSILAYAENE